MHRTSIQRPAQWRTTCWRLVIGIACATGPDVLRAESRLADAVEKCDETAIKALLDEHVDVNAAQADGMTALHWAAHLDDLGTVKKLIAAGAVADSKNRYGVTPLSLACTNGNADIVSLLLEAGANPNTPLRGGETPLMTAARTGKPGPVQRLIGRGADVNAREFSGQTALMWAAAEGHTEVVELLIQSGADDRMRLKSGFTPFFFAVREGRLDTVRALLNAGVDVNDAMECHTQFARSPRNGTTPLIMAVENGHFELAVALLEAGADPNDQRCGFTALHVLTWVRKPNRGDGEDGDPAPTGSGEMTSLEFVRKLVQHGADVNARLENGPQRNGRINLKGATPFLLAASTADGPYLRLLLELGADPRLSNVDHCTPLLAAAGVGTLAPTEEAGTEPEAIDAVHLTLEQGNDVNAVDDNGETAMHGAAYKSLPKVVQMLADRGAKAEVWNRKNKKGWTPLEIAQGYRPGNFKPSRETMAAIEKVMRDQGVPVPVSPMPEGANAGDEYSKSPAKRRH